MTIRLSSGLRTSMVTEYGLRAMMDYGRILLFTGAQPSSADAAITRTHIGTISADGIAPIPGNAAGGLQLQQGYTPGTLEKYGTWVLNGHATGTVGWWRFVWNAADDGTESTYYPRIDGSFGDSFSLITASVVPATVTEIDTFLLTFPAQ